MTTEQITAATAFITHRAIRAQVASHLATGVSFLCPECQQIADTAAGCAQCDEARFTAQAAAYDALMGGAEASTGCDAYAHFPERKPTMQRLGTILRRQTRPLHANDHLRLTPEGEAALDAANLRAELPSIFDQVQAAARGGQTPDEIARAARAAGASDNLARQIARAARHLTDK